MAARRLPRLLLVTGMSGAGKSSVLDALEDMGWDTADNLPVDLLRDFVHGDGLCRTAPVAVGMDARSRGFDPEALPAVIRSIDGVAGEILYLDSSGAELMRRYDVTRRRHPLAPDRPAEDGIARERRLTGPLRNAAESVLDTTDLSPAELRDELRRRYGDDRGSPVLTISSFSFARGISRTADLVFDLRFLPNPNFVPQLKRLTGNHAAVVRYMKQQPETRRFLAKLTGFLAYLLPRYQREGKSYLTIALGCTGGRHRSVMMANALARILEGRGREARVRHRDLRLG